MEIIRSILRLAISVNANNLAVLIFLILIFSFQNKTESHELRLNEIQVIGTHNSYKQVIDKPIMDYLEDHHPVWAERFDYSHIELSEQLDLGLANLELDVFVDTYGGRYEDPLLYRMFPDIITTRRFDEDKIMQEPGFKVFHLQDIDFRSHCLSLSLCLHEIKTWSEMNPDHVPIFITVNAKDQKIDYPDTTIPELFDEKAFSDLNDFIMRELGEAKLILPRHIQGSFQTVESAVLNGNWPTLNESKGKFIFILDETGKKLEDYRMAIPAINDRTFFVNAEEGSTDAAIMIINNPIENKNRIQNLVKKGFIIRTRADADTYEARNNNFDRFNAARESGAQIITTDYYHESTHFKSSYKVSFENDSYFRKNPLLLP